MLYSATVQSRVINSPRSKGANQPAMLVSISLPFLRRRTARCREQLRGFSYRSGHSRTNYSTLFIDKINLQSVVLLYRTDECTFERNFTSISSGKLFPRRCSRFSESRSKWFPGRRLLRYVSHRNIKQSPIMWHFNCRNQRGGIIFHAEWKIAVNGFFLRGLANRRLIITGSSR